MSGEDDRREVIGGKWEVLGRLGAGGMGEVFEVRQLGIGRLAALKRIRWDQPQSEDLIARLTREGQFAGRFQHPHIVVIYDAGKDGGPYLVFERLRGESVARRLNHGVIPLPEAAASIVQVLDALACVHAQGVVHRDVKPGNVFLALDDAGRVCTKLLDFGIARLSADAPTGLANTDVTQSGGYIGSPRFLSPEQFRDASGVDGRADLWSTAVTFYCMLTRDAPWSQNVWDAARGAPLAVPSVTSIRPELPAALDAFFAKAFAPNITSRFQTAQEMSAALVALVPEAALALSPSVGAARVADAPVGVTTPAPERAELANSTAPQALSPAASPSWRPRDPRVGVALALFVVAFLLAQSFLPGHRESASSPATQHVASATLAVVPPHDASASDGVALHATDVLPSSSDVAEERVRAPQPRARIQRPRADPPTLVRAGPPEAPSPDATAQLAPALPPPPPDEVAPERCRAECPHDPWNCPGCR